MALFTATRREVLKTIGVAALTLSSPGFPIPTASASVTRSVGLPALAVATDQYGPNYEVALLDQAYRATRLTHDPSMDSFLPRISPDRQSILFYRTPAGVLDRNPALNELWTMRMDGSNQQRILAAGAHGWAIHGHAEWWPDSTLFLMLGGAVGNEQVFLTRLDGTIALQVTNRAGENLDPSPHPAMTAIAFTGVAAGVIDAAPNREVFTIPTFGGPVTRVTHDSYAAYDPYYSPDGSRICWLRNSNFTALYGRWGLYLTRPDGTGTTKVIDDGNINSRGVWSKDGQWLYFHRLLLTVGKWHIWKIRPNGTGLTQLTSGASNYIYPSV